jgi:quercetin dioxygenase-like cupin family protein
MATAPMRQTSQVSKNEATTFSLRGAPLLKKGATMESVGLADNLWAHVKIYSCGGENGLHKHDKEDHVFLVLQGKAIFEFGDGSKKVAAPFEGVFLPRGTLYRFQADPADNLVMFRVGGAQVTNPADVDSRFKMPRELMGARTDKESREADYKSASNGAHSEPVEIWPGRFFAGE